MHRALAPEVSSISNFTNAIIKEEIDRFFRFSFEYQSIEPSELQVGPPASPILP